MEALSASLSLDDGLGLGGSSSSSGGYVSASRALLEKKKQDALRNGKAPEKIDLSKSVRTEQKHALLDQIVENFNMMVIGTPNVIVIVSGYRTCITPSFLNIFKMFVGSIDIFLNVYQTF